MDRPSQPPANSHLELHQRLVAQFQIERQQRLEHARLEASRTGKEPFEYQRFREAYQGVAATVPSERAMEEEYYLQYESVRNLKEFIRAVQLTDLHDGGDMHLD